MFFTYPLPYNFLFWLKACPSLIMISSRKFSFRSSRFSCLWNAILYWQTPGWVFISFSFCHKNKNSTSKCHIGKKEENKAIEYSHLILKQGVGGGANAFFQIFWFNKTLFVSIMTLSSATIEWGTLLAILKEILLMWDVRKIMADNYRKLTQLDQNRHLSDPSNYWLIIDDIDSWKYKTQNKSEI